MVELSTFSPLLLLLLLLFPLLIFISHKLIFSTNHNSHETTKKLVKSYPFIGSFLSLPSNIQHRVPFMTELLRSSPTSTVILKLPLWGGNQIITANPAIVEHILKTKFPVYQKGKKYSAIVGDLLGKGIFSVDGDDWKFQRRVASHEFSSSSLRKFVEQVVDAELENRLIPILDQSIDTGKVFDLQSLLRRFTFDNICKISFGYDPALLLPSLPEAPFAAAFEEAVAITSLRFRAFLPLSWRIKRFLNIGSEKRLKIAVSKVRDFTAEIVKRKKKQIIEDSNNSNNNNLDLLSRFLKSGHSDEEFITDIAISFILAGRDTTSAALTWFFWLISKNQSTEKSIVEEINRSDGNPNAKDLVYLHAALHESMRLYPPVVVDIKYAVGEDEVLPDGTEARRGTGVAYHVYAMGRMESIWGEDWAEYRPERWLKEGVFVGKDPYSYPVFQAGPRVCLGKEMALLQMKRVAAGVLRRFRVVPAVEEGFQPVLLPYLTAEMEGGLPVRFERRV